MPILLMLALALGGCASRARPAAAPPAPPAAAPSPASPASTPPPVPAAGPIARRPSTPALTGLVTRDAIESFNEVWKGLRAQDYQPDPESVSLIRASLRDVEVFAVVATWCPDTRRELPRFFKIADQSGWPIEKVKLLAVDRTKKDPDGLTGKWNVTRVPTFIFQRAGQEIGRVVERPTTTLEKDIAGIVGPR